MNKEMFIDAKFKIGRVFFSVFHRRGK
ncbi:hypothetical protein MXB_5205 [Myxobolus squamalis]|nr:hypothetical protein MXB_5205 [Myxobolus squamalis]